MTLWRVEWSRLVRTGRIWVVLGVYLLFGVLGPVSAAYLPEIIQRFGGGLEVTVPEPVPAAGIAQFTSNAGQLGLLAVVAVAAGALTFDARPEWAAFLRTRIGSLRELVVPRVVVPTLVAAAALALGTVVAAIGTVLLIGGLPVADLVIGTAFGGLYLAFAVAVVAVAASIARQTIGTVLLAVGVLLVFPILQIIGPLEPWLPSKLLGATDALLAGVGITELARAAAVTAVTVPLLVWLAIVRLARREL